MHIKDPGRIFIQELGTEDSHESGHANQRGIERTKRFHQRSVILCARHSLRRQANCRQAKITGARKPRCIRNIAYHAADLSVQVASTDRFVDGYEI
jgi:hypothetical protein